MKKTLITILLFSIGTFSAMACCGKCDVKPKGDSSVAVKCCENCENCTTEKCSEKCKESCSKKNK